MAFMVSSVHRAQGVARRLAPTASWLVTARRVSNPSPQPAASKGICSSAPSVAHCQETAWWIRPRATGQGLRPAHASARSRWLAGRYGSRSAGIRLASVTRRNSVPGARLRAVVMAVVSRGTSKDAVMQSTLERYLSTSRYWPRFTSMKELTAPACGVAAARSPGTSRQTVRMWSPGPGWPVRGRLLVSGAVVRMGHPTSFGSSASELVGQAEGVPTLLVPPFLEALSRVGNLGLLLAVPGVGLQPPPEVEAGAYLELGVGALPGLARLQHLRLGHVTDGTLEADPLREVHPTGHQATQAGHRHRRVLPFGKDRVDIGGPDGGP